MSNNAVRAVFEPLRTIAGTSITGSSYIAIGTPLSNPSHLILTQNNTDVVLYFSIDGVNDHFALPSGGFFLPDVTANRTNTGGAFFIAEGTQFYVRAPAADPSLGAVYLTTIFGFQNS